MAHVKSGGTTNQQVPRPGKRLGVKKFGGEKVRTGNVILKQKGMVYKAGKGVGVGRDHTIFSMMDGFVKFGKRLGKTVVNVVSTKE